MTGSNQYGYYHTSTFYPRGCETRKFSIKSFRKEVTLAHLIGRAYCAQKIIENHAKAPYVSIEEMIGDLQIEMVNCMNEFKKESNAKMPKLSLENTYLKKEILNEG